MRLIREVRTHIRRSPYQAIAAILTMFLTFFVGGVFFLATLTSAAILQYFESKPQITVFFTPKAGQKEVDAVKGKLEGTGKIASTHFVSKDDALKLYREQNKNDPLLLEMVSAEILPASLEVSATSPTYLTDVANTVNGMTGVDEVVYQRDVVDTLIRWTNAVRVAGFVLGLILILDSLLIIGTVISMKVALKRDEIEILSLVGASPWSVKAPFMVEGGTYGVIGAGIASIILTVLVVWMQPALFVFLHDIPLLGALLINPTNSIFLAASGLFIFGNTALGFVLGVLGSMIALKRFL